MQMQTLVSTKYQVVIPKEARRKINLKPGQKMNVEVTANQIILSPSKAKRQLNWPKDYIKKFGGIWEGVDVDKYIDKERNSWDD